jgi:hypothetical protein
MWIHSDRYITYALSVLSARYLCDLKQLMAAKKSIMWPLSTTIQAQTYLLATKHKMAESTEIKRFLAESTNSENGFHRLLTCSQQFTAIGASAIRQF